MALFTGPAKFFRRIALKRNDTTTLDPDDFIQAVDDNNNILFRLANDGHIVTNAGILDFGTLFGTAEWRIVQGGNSTTVFRVWNAGASAFHWICTPSAFQVFGSNYTNGSNTMQPVNFRGWKTTAGAPTDGTWSTNDALWDGASPRRFWICTAGGTPGTWS